MKFLNRFLFASAIATMAFSSVDADVLIDFDAGNVGNGQLVTDGASAVLLNETGGLLTNGNGRAIAGFGGNGFNGGGVGSLSNTADIINNAGVQISGFTAFRGQYVSANNGFGFLENGSRFGEGDVVSNGDAFSNSGGFFLFSDVINTSVSALDSVEISFLAGSESDMDSADFQAFLLIDGATAGTQIGSAQTVVGADAATPRLSFTATGLTAASSIQLVIEAEASVAGVRSVVDNIRLEVVRAVPEPSSLAILGFVGLVGLVRRRK